MSIKGHSVVTEYVRKIESRSISTIAYLFQTAKAEFSIASTSEHYKLQLPKSLFVVTISSFTNKR